MSGFSRYQIRFGQAAVKRGHSHGLAWPCLQLLCHAERLPLEHPAQPSGLTPADDALLVPMPPASGIVWGKARTPMVDGAAGAGELLRLLEPLNTLLVRLQATAGWPVTSGAVVEQLGRQKGQAFDATVVLAFPALDPAVLRSVLPWVFSVLGGEVQAPAPAAPAPPMDLAACLKRLESVAPGGTNTRLLLQAAFARDVPVLRVHGQVFQFGWGRQRRWLESSFTDADSVISAQLARDKRAAHALLRRAGLPVPRQAAVRTEEQACQAAAAMGYPVVIKPADLDGGKGVEAGLPDEASLKRAFVRARAHSANLVVESHMEGQDFRLGVLAGRMCWATYREPAGVWGDGVLSVAGLIDVANRDPRRGTRRWSQMAPIRVQAEGMELLAEQGLALSDVPASGVFVRLRRAANTSSGGRPVDVTDTVHPDNAALAVRVAGLFGLNLAGVDFISPDITRSWREVGGGLCEVNGQPQFSVTRPDLAERVLEALVPGCGRIPVVVVLAEGRWGAWTDRLHTGLQSLGLQVGFALADGVFIGQAPQGCVAASRFDAVQTLLLDTRVAALVVATDGRDWLQSGLPVDRVDLVMTDGTADARVLELLVPASAEGFWTVRTLLPDWDEALPAWIGSVVDFIQARALAHLEAGGAR